MKSSVCIQLEVFFGEDIVDIAKKMNYLEENILVLEDKFETIEKDFPDVHKAILSCNHNKDSRTINAYAQDLIGSWIFEDYLLYKLVESGLKIKLSGADQERKLLYNKKVSAGSDYYVEGENNNGYLELMNDYTGFWEKAKKGHLRDSKYNSMLNKVGEHCKSLFLGIDMKNMKYFLIDISKASNVKRIEFHYAFRKPAYEVDLSKVYFEKIDFKKMADDINKILEEN